jgi:hypothetical protein
MTSTMTTEMSTPRATPCEDCETGIASHTFVGTYDQVWRLCDTCNDAAEAVVEDMRVLKEEEDRRREEDVEEEEELGICVSCEKQQARIIFTHMTNGNFELCGHCFEWADHEADYGVEFGCSSSEDGGEY